jgi:hypothetical protein
MLCTYENEIHFDIISDVHGRFDKLTNLMSKLGYLREGDGFVPPSGHRALFPGMPRVLSGSIQQAHRGRRGLGNAAQGR